jgi:hypothetical protein
MATDTIEAARLEELRFAKRQQWAVAIATITFVAGAFHMAHNVEPAPNLCEKLVTTILVSIASIAGSAMIVKLQYHLRTTRLAIDPNDSTPWRGLDVVIGLIIALIISAAAVCYSLWR